MALVNRRGANRTARAAVARSVLATAREMSERGLSPGTSGNVSCRYGSGMLITPSGLAYDAIKPSDIVEVDGHGRWGEGDLEPSSEWQFHLAVYRRRPDLNAIVHTHSTHAVVLACARRPIPAFHYMVAVAGGADIPCVPYALFGTQALADLVAAGMAERSACLLAHHGQVAAGVTLAEALDRAQWVEILAEQYSKVLALGSTHVLSSAEMAEVLERFSTYGRKALRKPQEPGA